MKMTLIRGKARKSASRRGKSHIAPISEAPDLLTERSGWAYLLPELLSNIIQRVEVSETSWPGRRSIVACASVCKSWREVTKKVVQTPERCGRLTFPISLMQPGPRDDPIQCFIRRDMETSTFQLYLGLSPALSGNSCKLLLAAKKTKRVTCMEFIIYMIPDGFSHRSHAYIGKLRSNFLRTKFRITETQTLRDSPDQSNCMRLKQIIPKELYPTRATEKVASISYDINVLRTRGPRRIRCILHTIPAHAIQEGGTAPTPTERTSWNSEVSSKTISDEKKPTVESTTESIVTQSEPSHRKYHPLVLKNKTPRWHEQLQCWCLNFKGRVTVASVKNFQLVAAPECHPEMSATAQDRVILQFGKIGRNMFSMDYRYPLSAFQAFAISLSSFGTKPACE